MRGWYPKPMWKPNKPSRESSGPAFQTMLFLAKKRIAGPSPRSTYGWLIRSMEPINFAHRIPHFAVSIAYYHQQVAQCGVVVNPMRGAIGIGPLARRRRLFQRHSVARQRSRAVEPNDDRRGFYYDRGKMMEATLAAIGDFFRQQIHVCVALEPQRSIFARSQPVCMACFLSIS